MGDVLNSKDIQNIAVTINQKFKLNNQLTLK